MSDSNGHLMTRAILVAPRQFKMEEISIPAPADDQVLVKVHSCALCTFEQRIYSGEEPIYPFAGGHEVSGTVIEKGRLVFGLAAGDHVTLSGLVRCGQCESCRRGYDNICENQNAVKDPQGGPAGLGEYVLRSGADCFKVAPEVNLEHAALAEPLACVVRSVKRANLQHGEKVVIIGAGIMGLFHLQLARRANAVVIVSEPDEKRREKAVALGADAVFNPLEKDYVQTVKALTGGRGSDVAFICVAHTATIEPAIVASANDGRVLCYSSFFPKGKKIEVDPNIFHKKEVVLSGTMSQTRQDYMEAAELISRRCIDFQPLISATYPLKDLETAFKMALTAGSYRVIVQP
jgi:2-desacetyl-2-hydroxyethyl bacteriochlorophyllide A dehydrogenase